MTTLRPEQIDRLQAALAADYPPAITPPAWVGPSAHLSNLLRSGPRRKVVVLFDAVGDYDHDETMSTDAELAQEAQGLVVYKHALRWAESGLGTGWRPSPVPDELYPPDPDEFEHRHGQADDGVDWTEECEGGAVSHDSRRLRCWTLGHDWVCLQAGKWQGDGNFAVFVVLTVVPGPSAGALLAEDAGDAQTPAPAAIQVLQRRLGFALRAMPEHGEPAGLMPRHVMNTDGAYTVDAEGRVTGLNLSGADLVDTRALQAFPDLERLNLDNNALVAVDGLAGLGRLRELSLRGNLLQASPALDALSPLLVHPLDWAWEKALFG